MDMKRLRQKAGLRTIDVAFHLGVAESTVRNWERGTTMPTLRFDQLLKLLRLYECSLEEMEEALKQSMQQRGKNNIDKASE